MRIGILTTSYPRHEGDYAGGFVADLAASLVRAGNQVRVWAPHAPGLEERDSISGVPVTRFRYGPDAFEHVAYGDGIANNIRANPLAMLGLPGFFHALGRAGRDAAATSDVVHVNWAQTAALVARPDMPAPMVVTVHGSDVRLAKKSPRWRRSLLRGTANPPVSAVIAVSEDLARDLTELAPAVEPIVIPTGVDASLLDVERPHPAGGPPLLVFVGRLLESKGVGDLAEAFVALDRDATLRIVGAGPERNALARRFEQAGVSDRVSFTGALSHESTLKELTAADLVIVPSHAEGCGLVAVEACALGVPTVATRVGIHADLLRDGALLYEPGDIDALVARIRGLADDPDTRDSLAAQARERVARSYTWDALAQRIQEVYERAVAAGSAQ